MTHPPPGEAALALLKNYEQGPNGGFAPVPYLCPAGYQTIGWGHRIQAGDRLQPPLSAAEADRWLEVDVLRVGGQIGVTVKVPLTQSMMDALTCFVFNVGYGAFLGSTLLAALNAGQYAVAADEFLKWNKARNPKTGQKEPLAGLTRRRAAERALFLREPAPQ